MMKTLRSLFLILAITTYSFLAGCSTFNRDWKAMEQEPVPSTGMEGRWEGTWRSDASGHDGALRCIITRKEDESLFARYHAKYGGFLTFEYDMPMTVQRDGETYRFTAEADLGWLAGGIYEYDGTVVGDDFTSTYKSKSDHGTFLMRHVE